MKTLHIAVVILATAVGSSPAYGCPFAKTNNEQTDLLLIHRRSLRRRLSDTPEAKGKLKSIIDNRTKEQQKYRSNSQQNERSIGGSGGQARLLTTGKKDPTLPYSHVSDPDVENQFIVSYSSPEALAAIENHISAQPDSIKIKGHKNFSRPQKKKKKRGDRRNLQEEDSVGYAVIVTTEEPSIYMNMQGVTSIELDAELHIDMLNNDQVKKYIDEIDIERSESRRLQEQRPWGIDLVNVTHLWDLDPPAEPITICVVDTGYDLGHVDLPQLPVQNITGWDTGNANNGVWDIDRHGHGTHCAGSIGALGSNGQGVIGVIDDPTQFRFHIAKGLSDSGSGAGSAVLDAVTSCVEEGAKVISMSLGCDNCFSQATENFYQDVYDQNVLIIAAAGNSGDTRDHFPSGYPAVMSVASVAEGGGVGADNYGIL